MRWPIKTTKLAIVIILVAIVSATNADRAEPIEDGVEMRVSLVDAGRRAMPDNRFVRGEEILVKVRLRHVAALEWADREQAAAVKRAAAGAEAPGAVGTLPAPIPLSSSGGSPWTEAISIASSAGSVEARQAPNRKQTATELVDSTVEFWQLDSATLAAAGRLSVRFDRTSSSGDGEPLEQTVSFELVDRDQAVPAELARVAMRDAQSLFNEGRYVDSVTAANESIRLGPGDDVDLATAYRVLGASREQLGEAEAAIQAYEKAIETIERSHPGRSRLPTILGQKIKALGRL